MGLTLRVFGCAAPGFPCVFVLAGLAQALSFSASQVINAAGTLGSVKVSGVTENCHNCRLPPLCFIPYGQFTNGGTCSPSVGVLVNDADGYLLFDVRHYFNVELFDPDGNRFYKETLNLKEHSTHTLFVTLRGTSMVATLYQDLEGNKIWIPLVIAICVIAGVAIVYTILSALWLKKGERDREESARSDGHIQVRRGDDVTSLLVGCNGVRCVSAAAVHEAEVWRSHFGCRHLPWHRPVHHDFCELRRRWLLVP
jgi:hypothetical protein